MSKETEELGEQAVVQSGGRAETRKKNEEKEVINGTANIEWGGDFATIKSHDCKKDNEEQEKEEETEQEKQSKKKRLGGGERLGGRSPVLPNVIENVRQCIRDRSSLQRSRRMQGEADGAEQQQWRRRKMKT